MTAEVRFLSCYVYQLAIKGATNSPHIVSIHILDDNSLLNTFYLYRPPFLGEDGDDFDRLIGGGRRWVGGRWWYQLAHVCQRWRNLILGSSSYLGLSLVCANGTPVENMLTHSPPLPLTVDYVGIDDITADDEQGILLALEQRHRVRHLRLLAPVRNLQELIMEIDGEFPILEYLIVYPTKNIVDLRLPETLQAPHLRHLTLGGFACPIRSRLHPTAANLVALLLIINQRSAYFQPNILLQWISFMPQLENLEIAFSFAIPNRDVERQLTRAPIMAHVTLPNLRLFRFRGVSAYLEAVLGRITTPRLETLLIQFFKQITFSVPRLMQFINTAENVRSNNADIRFSNERAHMLAYMTNALPFEITIDCWHLDWQVSSVAQISNAVFQALSPVGHLTLRHHVHNRSSEEHNDVDRIEWRKLLRSLSNVEILHVENGLVEGLSRCLRLEDGELPLDLLPELQELKYFGGPETGDRFTSFIDARQKAGRPVTLIRDSLSPSPSPSPSSFDPRATTSPGDEVGDYIET